MSIFSYPKKGIISCIVSILIPFANSGKDKDGVKNTSHLH